MSALPNRQLPISSPEAEVIYVVVPQTPAMTPVQPRPYSFAESLSLMFYNARFKTEKAGNHSLALSFALFVVAVGGIWAYYAKSAMGIDLFPHQHVENFAPIPGWQR